jgi:hypothetical protein
MAKAVSRRPLTTETRVRTLFSPCGISGEHIDTEKGFYTRSSGFPCQHHSTVDLCTHTVGDEQ